ncbi:hypothetical protein H0H92_010533 [Tricholoma furcatifolium]|nr:hypothetical protein H0H92_010533 [Tricholoma furcatifolium]
MDMKGDASAVGVVYPQKTYGQIALSNIPLYNPLTPRTDNKRLSSADRRPLRSSPLAGPAVSPASGTPAALVQSEEALTLNVPFNPLPPARIIPERRRASESHVVRFATFRLDKPSSSKTDKNTSSAPRQHVSAFRTSPPSSYPKEKLPHSLQFTDSPSNSPNVLRRHSRSSSQPNASSNLPSLPGISHSRSTSTSTKSTSQDPSPSLKNPQSGFEHWMAANTYATIPRFSRLNINASNVVLPISAREYREMSTVKKAKEEEAKKAKLEEAKKEKAEEAKRAKQEKAKKPKESMFKRLKRKKAIESLRPTTMSNTTFFVENRNRPPSSSSSIMRGGTVSSHTSTVVASEEDGNLKEQAMDSRSTSPTLTFFSCESCESLPPGLD